MARAEARIELWLEANQSRRSTLRVIEMLLEAFGHAPDKFQLPPDR